MLHKIRRMALPAALLLPLFASGCALWNTVQVTHCDYTTVGQKLLDLKKAREAGAITEAEYEELREKVKRGPASMYEETYNP